MSDLTKPSSRDASISTARDRITSHLADEYAVAKDGHYNSPYPQYQVTRPNISRLRVAISGGLVPALWMLVVVGFVIAGANPNSPRAAMPFVTAVALAIAVTVATHKWRSATYYRPQYAYTTTIALSYDTIEARTRKHAGADSRVSGIAADITAVRAGLFELLEDLDTLVTRTQRSQVWHAAETLGPEQSDVERRDALAQQVVDVLASVTAAAWAADQIASSSATSTPVTREPVKPFVSAATTQNQEQMRQALERLSTVHS